MSQSIEAAVEKYREFLEVVEAKINAAIESGKRYPATKLAKDICCDFGMEWPRAYQLIGFYMQTRPELDVGLGPNGGIGLRKEVE
jgi:hypothetical protein